MKKTLVIVILALAGISAATKAQVQVSVGPGAGFSYAAHALDEGDEPPGHLGMLVTSQIDMQFSRYLGLLVWVDFYNDMSAGREEILYDFDQAYDYRVQISYLHLAPTLKFCIPGSPFYLFGGPGVGFKTRGRMAAGYEGLHVEEDISDMHVRLDVRFGAGYDIFLSRRLTLSPFAGFNVGLTDVTADSGWKAHALQAGIVLRYNILK